MDFGTLLHVAKKNSEVTKNEGKYYSTKFAPPKKVSKEKKLSENIQKFLQKREEEERRRKEEERLKVNSLLAMRDEKSKNKIKKMLKVTKSANKSVLDDVDTEHTAVTAEGPMQPDEDDYGYVSNEANAFFQKYIEKVKDIAEDKGFAPSRPQSLHDLSGTKERVKAAITREIEEKKSRHRSSTSSSSHTKDSSEHAERSERVRVSSKPLYNPEAERLAEERKKREEQQQKAKFKKPAPPPMDFQALLKLAEVKQHEPVEVLLPTVKKKEPERLFTSKERREYEERQKAKEARERRLREKQLEPETKESKDRERPSTPAVSRMEPNGRIPKLNQTAKPSAAGTSSSSSSYEKAKSGSSSSGSGLNGYSSSSKSSSSNSSKPMTSKPTVPEKMPSKKEPQSSSSSYSSSSNSSNSVPSKTSKNPYTNSASSASGGRPSQQQSSYSSDRDKNSIKSGGSKPSSAGSGGGSSTSRSSAPSTPSKPSKPDVAKARQFPPPDVGKSRQFPPPDVGKTRQFPPPDVGKARQFPPPDVGKARQFPPPDVQRSKPAQSSRKPEASSSSGNKKMQPNKRRIIDSDSEYDSEMDDFIDDGDCEEDISSHIKAIFGYDKSKYRYMDDDDDAAMESNFAQVQREEYISKKIGIQEDLEDMKMEAIEKKRKMMKKRKL